MCLDSLPIAEYLDLHAGTVRRLKIASNLNFRVAEIITVDKATHKTDYEASCWLPAVELVAQILCEPTIRTKQYGACDDLHSDRYTAYPSAVLDANGEWHFWSSKQGSTNAVSGSEKLLRW
jgi:hypothetical protein